MLKFYIFGRWIARLAQAKPVDKRKLFIHH